MIGNRVKTLCKSLHFCLSKGKYFKSTMNVSVKSVSSWTSNSTDVPYVKFDTVFKTQAELNGVRFSPKMSKALRSKQTDCKGI